MEQFDDSDEIGSSARRVKVHLEVDAYETFEEVCRCHCWARSRRKQSMK